MSELGPERYCAVAIGTVAVSQNRIQFSVSKNSKPEPNKAKVSIYNLNPDHRQTMLSAPSASVQIDAGYPDEFSTIFVGDLRFAEHKKDGPVDVVTTFESAEKGAAIQQARVSITVPKGTPPGDVLRTIARALGVGAGRSTAWGGSAIEEGNLEDAIAQLKANNVFASGTVLSGSAWREMTNVCRSLGLTWSVQGGKLQILKAGTPLAGRAIKLTPQTGLLGSPSIDAKGVLSGECMMLGDMYPGRIIVLDSQFVHGQFVLDETTHTGDYSPISASGDWKIAFKAKAY